MYAPMVLILESTATVVNLLSAACPTRPWLLRSVRELSDVQDELRSDRPAVVVAEFKPRFFDAIAWAREHRPAIQVVVLMDDDESQPFPVLDLGIACCLQRADVFERLPALVHRMLTP